MTDRIHALTVTLEENIREDDIQPLIAAIMQLRGVLSVSPHVADVALHTATMRVKNDLRERLYKVIEEL